MTDLFLKVFFCQSRFIRSSSPKQSQNVSFSDRYWLRRSFSCLTHATLYLQFIFVKIVPFSSLVFSHSFLKFFTNSLSKFWTVAWPIARLKDLKLLAPNMTKKKAMQIILYLLYPVVRKPSRLRHDLINILMIIHLHVKLF